MTIAPDSATFVFRIASLQELSAPETKDVLVQGRPFQVTYSIVNTGEEWVVTWTAWRVGVWRALIDCSSIASVFIATFALCSTAFDVVLTDNFPEEYFDIISGTPSMKFAELAPNENQTSVVVLKPKVSGIG